MAKTAIVKRITTGVEVHLLEDCESWSYPAATADPSAYLRELGYTKASDTTLGDTRIEVWSNFQAPRTVPPPLPRKS